MRWLSTFAIVLLLGELFYPFALAQATPSPSPGTSSCYVSSMSPQDVHKWWNSLMGFQGDEVNALNWNELLKNKPGKLPIQINVNVNTAGPHENKLYKLKDVAGILGVSPKEISKATGVPTNGSLSAYQIQNLKKVKEEPDMLQKILGSGGGAVTKETSPSENLKIMLPNGKQIALADLRRLVQINKDSCMLNHEDIQGKASYIALLDKDLWYGFQRGSLVSRQPQHLSSNDLLSAVTLNGGANILIPSMYLRWISAFNKINTFDMLANLGVGMWATSRISNIEKRTEKLQGYLDSDANLLNSLGTAPGVKPDPKVIDNINKDLNAKSADYTKLQQSFFKKMQAGRLATYSKSRAYTGIALGLLWTGPARYVYSIDNAIIFRTSAIPASKRREYYLKVFVHHGDVVPKFRSATDFLMMGKATELIGKYLHVGMPLKAFGVNDVFLINNDEGAGPRNVLSTQKSSTSLMSSDGRWIISTNWKGRSLATNFENVFQDSDITSLPLESNMLPPNALVDRKELMDTITRLGSVALPAFITAKAFRTVWAEPIYTIVPTILMTNALIDWTDRDFKNVECNEDVVNNYIKRYIALTLIADALTYALPPISSYSGVLKWAKVVGNVAGGLDFVNKLNIPNVLLMYYSTDAMRYVTTCKDNKYTILTYQHMSDASTGSQETMSTIKSHLKGIDVDRLIPKLNISSALGGIGSKVDLKSMPEVLNLRSIMSDQYGSIEPKDLYYLHLDSANEQWWGAFEKKCFRRCMQSKDEIVCVDGEEGVKIKDKNGNDIASFDSDDWKKRALMSQMLTDLGRTIVPNKLISADLNCGDSPLLEINSQGSTKIDDPSCPAAACIISTIKDITGEGVVNNELTFTFGPLVSLYTSEGRITAGSGYVRFLRTKNVTKEQKVGEEITIPALGVQGSGKIVINGNGDVSINGPMAGGKNEEKVGTLVTAIFKKAKLEFDASTGKLYVAVYVMGSIPASSVKSVSTVATKDGIKLHAEPGVEAGPEGKQFKEALDKIQGKTGFQVLETPDKIYMITTDKNGNKVLRIIDKKTGKFEDHLITGPIHQEGDQAVVPTKDGNYKFKFDMQNGKPYLTVQAPGQAPVTSPLILARGPGGILAFDPNTGTWRIFNGQDIPLNPAFSTKGITYTGTGNGVKGVPTQNLLGYAPVTAGAGGLQSNPLLALPSWPENLIALIAMIFVVLAGLLFIRFKA